MEKNLSRRAFLKKTAGAGAASLLGAGFTSVASSGEEEPVTGGVANGSGEQSEMKSGAETKTAAPGLPDIAVVTSRDKGASAEKAMALLGGIGQFVPRGSKVAILANAQRNNPGVFTSPEITGTLVRLCREAGAKQVNCISWTPREKWKETGQAQAIEKAGGELMIVSHSDEALYKPVPVPRGLKLREARVMNALFDHDVFINLAICKNHSGNHYTGVMKNMMGVNSPQNNRLFHTGNFKNDDIEHLDQCIADLNTVLTADLSVIDATEFIITNGPFGPGKIHRPWKVVAGTDPVAVDAYCAALWGLVPQEIFMIEMAHKHGLGELDPTKLKLQEVELQG